MAVKKKDFTEISSKSTKDQILSAYNEVVDRLQENQIQSPQEEKKKEDEKQTMSKSSQISLEGIISHLGELKITLTKHLDSLSENLVNEFNKLSTLRQAIEIEQRHIQELYEIKETAHSLSGLILLQKEEKEKFELSMKEERELFEKEMGQEKAAWDKKKAGLEASYNELKEKLEKQHKRDEEEYKYNLELSRRQELQDHALKKEALEKELEEKRLDMNHQEDMLKSRLQEIEKLKERVDQFPDELARETAKAVQEATQRLESQHHFTVALKEKEIEGEKNLLLQKITSLEAKIKEQAAFIIQLTQKANEATNQVQTIACKALEASSSRLSSYGDRVQEISHSPP